MPESWIGAWMTLKDHPMAWKARVAAMTLEEKRVELSKAPDFSCYAFGLSAVMLVGILPLFVWSMFSGYEPVAVAWIPGSGCILFAVPPIAGLHWGLEARLAKKYGVYVRKTEHTTLDILFWVMVFLALETQFSYLHSLVVNLLFLTVGILVQIVLFRWHYSGKSPIKPSS